MHVRSTHTNSPSLAMLCEQEGAIKIPLCWNDRGFSQELRRLYHIPRLVLRPEGDLKNRVASVEAHGWVRSALIDNHSRTQVPPADSQRAFRYIISASRKVVKHTGTMEIPSCCAFVGLSTPGLIKYSSRSFHPFARDLDSSRRP